MLRVLLLVLTIVLLLMTAPVAAIPICPTATMADYLALGSTGCNLKNLTFLNFSYSGLFKVGIDHFGGGTLFPGPPSQISVQPRSNPSLGAGGAALGFSLLPPLPGPGPFFGGTYWGDVTIGFEVFARTGPGIVRNDLSADIGSVADLQSGSIFERTVPGGSLLIVQSATECGGPFPAPCANPAKLSIPFTRFQEIDITGRNVIGIEAGFATPEPATLLLVGTGAAGVGLARWWKRRRALKHNESPNVP
jgi:hypothetical protein